MSGESDFAQPEDDPSVAPVEAILDRVAIRLEPAPQPASQRPKASLALWICACVTMDDAPVWLIYVDDADRVVWCRVPDGAEAEDVVNAASVAGGHTDPDSVLAWLRGDALDPWAGGEGWGDDDVVTTLSQAIHER